MHSCSVSALSKKMPGRDTILFFILYLLPAEIGPSLNNFNFMMMSTGWPSLAVGHRGYTRGSQLTGRTTVKVQAHCIPLPPPPHIPVLRGTSTEFHPFCTALYRLSRVKQGSVAVLLSSSFCRK